MRDGENRGGSGRTWENRRRNRENSRNSGKSSFQLNLAQKIRKFSKLRSTGMKPAGFEKIVENSTEPKRTGQFQRGANSNCSNSGKTAVGKKQEQ